MDRLLQIGGFLQSELGLTREQAAGVLGNFKRETGLDLSPSRNEGGKVGLPTGVGGYGIAQWTGSRQNDLVRFAGSREKAADLNAQLRFLAHELKGPERRALESLRTAKTPEEAAVIFDRDFERSGVKALDQRRQLARRAYDMLAPGGGTGGGTRMAAVPPAAVASANSSPARPSSDPQGLDPLSGLISSIFKPSAATAADSAGGPTRAIAQGFLGGREDFARRVGVPTSLAAMIGMQSAQGRSANPAATTATQPTLVQAEDPIPGLLQKGLAGIFGVGAASAGDTSGGASAASVAQPLQGGGGKGGRLRVGRIARPEEDIFPTTGAHLDVRIQKPDGTYIDPRSARSLLANLQANGKPLFTQSNGSFVPSFQITSPFGRRKAPAPGASENHYGEDHAIPANTELHWTGGGTYSRGRGYGMVTMPDGMRVKFLHTVEK